MAAYVENLFRITLNMSVTACVVIFAVVLLRLLLKKAPKALSFALWFVVLFRLLCPVSFESALSLFGLFGSAGSMEHIPANIGMTAQPQVDLILPAVTGAVNASLPAAAPLKSANPMQIILFVSALAWALGAIILLVYSASSYFLLMRRISTATLIRDNIYQTERVDSPFVCGFIKPRIILPAALEKAETEYIILHEKTHIRRRDHLFKPLWFFAACLHWFNPFVWLSFRLMSRDMEMSCDEAVIREMGDHVRADYSASLLALSLKRPLLSASPLAFGETGTKTRVKNVLGYKRPVFWVIAAAAVCVFAVCFILVSNPQKSFDIEKTRTDAMIFSTRETDLSKIGTAAAENYYNAFMGRGVPGEYRITSYKITDSELFAGDSSEFFVRITSDYKTTGPHFLSPNGNYITKIPNDINSGGTCEGDRKEFRIKSLGNGRYEIISVVQHTLELTLQALQELAEKGENLSWEDFAPYKGNDVGSGLTVMQYVIDDEYAVLIGGNPNEKPLYIYLIHKESEEKLDVRSGSVEEFCRLHTAWEETVPPQKETVCGLMKLGKNGAVAASIPSLSADEKTLLYEMIFSYSVQSAAWTGVDPDTLDGCYMIRAAYSDGSQTDYYVFMKDGYACMQSGKDGRYSRIYDTHYQALSRLFDFPSESERQVEEHLAAIMSSPLTSSNPGDYIKAHRNEYETILKLGPDALSYMLSCFENGEGDTLKGHIMMLLCEDLLGQRSNLKGQSLTPSEWYKRLQIRTETTLPDFSYTGDDPLMKLACETLAAEYRSGSGFVVVAPHIFGGYEENDRLKVFVTTFYSNYRLYGNSLYEGSAGVVPAAITYVKNADGGYTLENFTQTKDGSYFKSSIEEFCVMPVSGKKIPGLPDQIMRHYGDYGDIRSLQEENLKEHLIKNNQYGVYSVRQRYNQPDEIIQQLT